MILSCGPTLHINKSFFLKFLLIAVNSWLSYSNSLCSFTTSINLFVLVGLSLENNFT